MLLCATANGSACKSGICLAICQVVVGRMHPPLHPNSRCRAHPTHIQAIDNVIGDVMAGRASMGMCFPSDEAVAFRTFWSCPWANSGVNRDALANSVAST